MKFDKMKELRQTKGLTIEALAFKAGVSVRTVNNAERGKPINFSTAKLLAAALGVKLSDVVGGRHA